MGVVLIVGDLVVPLRPRVLNRSMLAEQVTRFTARVRTVSPSQPAERHAPAGPPTRMTRVRTWPPVPVDPLGPALAVLAGYVYSLQGFNGYLSRDLALYAYAGQQVAEGVPPYEGVINRSRSTEPIFVPGVGALAGRLVLDVDEVAHHAGAVPRACPPPRSGWPTSSAGVLLSPPASPASPPRVALIAVSGFNLYATNGPREKTTDGAPSALRDAGGRATAASAGRACSCRWRR